MTLTGANFLAIVVAAIAAWIFGAAYYGPLGKTWLAAQGRTMEATKAAEAGKSGFEKAFPFVLCFIAELIMAWMMAGLMGHLGALSIRGGVISALFVWFGFVLTSHRCEQRIYRPQDNADRHQFRALARRVDHYRSCHWCFWGIARGAFGA